MSQSQRIRLHPAYVLHQRAYRDSSRIVDLFTEEYGRVAVVARGVRRPRSALKAVLQPFVPILASWTSRGDLGTLTGAEADGQSAQIGRERLFCAYYLNELLLRLLQRQDPHKALFERYARALLALAGDAPEAPILRIFEKRLLEVLGYGLELERDVESGAAIEPGLDYLYRLETGATHAEGHAGAMVFPGSSLLALARENLADPAAVRDATVLLRAALALYLGERPLQSRRVLVAVRRGSSAAREAAT